jgi:hypothetical protein
MRAHHQHLVEVGIRDLRPTQMTVGRVEVERKLVEWSGLKRRVRERRLTQHWFPAVLGPEGRYFIVDHHHLGLALLELRVASGWVLVLDDLSWLGADRFWRIMEFRQWAHPYDERGRRRGFEDIPKRVTGLRDDPYRGLAGLVRGAGGFAKDITPYSEFLWADYFRPLVSARLIERSPGRATAKAVALARQADARYLPGWAGKARRKAD